MPSPAIRLRHAIKADLEYLSELGRHPAVEPFLAPGAGAAPTAGSAS